MDASSHKLYSLGIADNVADVPLSVQKNATNAEALAVVERLLGLRVADLPRLSSTNVVSEVTDRIYSVMDETRASIGRTNLVAALNTNLTRAMHQIQPNVDFTTANTDQKIQAIAQALYESLPPDMIHKLGVMSASVNFTIENGEPASIIIVPAVIINGLPHNVSIDLNHPFWRKKDFTELDLTIEMENKNGSQIGIQNTNLQNYPITLIDATNLVSKRFSSKSLPSEHMKDLTKTGLEIPPASPGAPAQPFTLTVKIDDLLRGATTFDAPTGLQNRPIGEFDVTQIAELINYRGTKGDFPYWKFYIDPVKPLPDEEVQTSTTLPLPPSPHYPKGPVKNIAIDLIRSHLSILDASRRNMTLLQAHTNVRIEHAKLQTLMDNLSMGTENPAGAALAFSLATSDREVMQQIPGNDQEKFLKALNQTRAKIDIIDTLEKIQGLQFSASIDKWEVATTTDVTLQTLEQEKKDIDIDIRANAPGGAGIPWVSDFMSKNGASWGAGKSDDIKERYNLTTRRDDHEAVRKDVGNKLAQRRKEIDEELSKYAKLTSAFEKLANAAIVADLYNNCSSLTKIIDDKGKAKKSEFGPKFDVQKRCQEIRDELALGSKEEIAEAIKISEANLKKSKSGGDKGDTLQQKIFEEHFKRQGLSTLEAQKSANYLFSRSLLDREMVGQHQQIIDGIFHAVDHGNEDGKLEKKGKNALQYITSALRVRSASGGLGIRYYDWDRESYQTLVSSYFSLKKIYEGTAPPSVNAPHAKVIQNAMQRIAEVLSSRHAQMIVNDMSNDLPDEDKKNLGSRKALSAETLHAFLTGEAPENYNPRIEEVLHVAETHIYRASGKEAWDKVKGNTKKVAAPFIWTLKGAGKVSKNLGTKTWAQKKNIATFALFTALGGPLGIAAWGAMKSMEEDAPSAQAA